MSNRQADMGMDVQVNRRLNSRYSAEVEAEVLAWLKGVIAVNVHGGRENVALTLRNGHLLINLINAIYAGTDPLPEAASRLRHPFKINTGKGSFKEMENIEIFLKAAEAYGVHRSSLFQTVDLYEVRNMAQVLNCLLQLGTECQRHNFSGPVCGPKPTYEQRRSFTTEQLNASKSIIGLQAGYNKGASQSGMSFGANRHIADISVEEMSAAAKSVIGLQAGSNQGASQKGMSMGATRHIADLKVEDMSESGKTVIGLQSGSNQGASQAGMSMGSIRHVADIRMEDMSAEGKSVIGLQAGSNQGANQSGMSIGAVRHIADIKTDNMSNLGQAVIGLQAGSNQGAFQSGMSFGTQRHINDLQVGKRN